nr:alcohol dehydrogenase catalytic domain-containing protein [Thermoleophilum album]
MTTSAPSCGSDLWPYRGLPETPDGQPMGHEAIGVVEEIGSEVRSLRPGDFVIMPFAISDGSCEICREGLTTACRRGGFFGTLPGTGAQAEAVRVPLADGTLYKLPFGEEQDERLLASLLTLSDVMGTGHHAAITARVEPGKSVAVVGDGAVGRVGVPQHRALPGGDLSFYRNVAVAGGPAPTRTYIPELLPDVLEGRIDPGRVFDRTLPLEETPAGYRAMAEREAIKVLLRP